MINFWAEIIPGGLAESVSSYARDRASGASLRFEQPIPIVVTPEALPWIKTGLIPRREITVEELRKRYPR